MITKHDGIVVTHHLFQIVSDSNVVTPINPSLQPRRTLGDCFSFVNVSVCFLEVFYSESDSGQGKDELIHSCLLLEANIDPAAGTMFSGSLQGYSFSELTFFVCFEMVASLDGVHKSDVVKVGVHFEEIFPEILGCLQILQISGDVLAWDKFFALLSVALIFKDNDLIDFENGGDPGDLADEVSTQSTRLWDFQYRVGEADSQVCNLRGCRLSNRLFDIFQWSKRILS